MARTLTFGEIMMRLACPDHQRFVQTNQWEVSYAGGEANVAVSLAAFGHDSAYVTALPENPLGEAAAAHLRFYGVDTSQIVRTRQGRLGLYFLETGAAQRPSQVLYDRAGSSISLMPPDAYNWEQLLAGRQAFHTTGITPPLSEACAVATTAALKTAKQLGAMTSFDLNYRAKLWTPQQAQSVVGPMLQHVDLVIGNEADAHDVLGIAAEKTDVNTGQIDHEGYRHVAEQIREKYGPRMVAITLRESESASVNHWSGCLLAGDEFYLSHRYSMHIVDRVGAGDSFAGGLISGLLDEMSPGEALEFAVAASCLKHSIPGDFNKVSKAEVLRLAGGDASGRVLR